MANRYRIRALGFDTRELTEEVSHADGSEVEPYGLWDTQNKCWVDQYGDPSDEYWATSKATAQMRTRDLNEYAAR